MNHSKLITGLLLFVFTAAIAVAEEYPIKFEILDADSNAYISKTEASVRKDILKNYQEIDKDKDGVLSLSEYQAYEGKGRFQPPEETETPELGAAPAE